MLAHQLIEQIDAPARAPAGDHGFLLAVLPGDTGDIQMRPYRAALDETFEELRGGDRAGIGAADILHIGNLGADHLVISRIKRQPPYTLAGMTPRFTQSFRQ